MEKIIIKPDSKEIVFRGKPEDGHVDVFSYNYEGAATNGLGGLFIVGHVQPATEDTSYMINLVASLAKREYYAQIDAAPRESFSKTLKKINEVLQDFFRNKDIKVNIGIFAVAGENILISRLGKFKIILGRDNHDIDILNNINLFNKEHIQEKEFSNIISGRIMPRDKIFAFYPARSITAREKNIKADLLKLNADDFSEKIGVIRKNNDSFLCAGIHLTINKYTESAIVSPPQPQELRPEPRAVLTAKTSKMPKEKSKITSPQELPDVRPIEKPESPLSKPTPSIKIEPTPAAQPEMKPEEDLNKSNVFYPGNKGLSMGTPETKPAEPEPSPLIRPSEFSSAKKDSFLSIILKKYKPSGVYVIGQQPLFNKKKIILTTSLIAVIIAAGIAAKFTFMPSLPIPGIDSPEDKAADALLEQARAKFQTAQSYRDANNLLEARRALFELLTTIESSNSQDEDIIAIKQEILTLWDQIDKAADASPGLFQEVTEGLGDDFQVWSFIWSLAKGEIKIQKPDIANMLSWYPYQDNLYVLAPDGLFKIADAAKGKTNAVSWLNQNVFLPPQPLLLAVDSKIYVLTESGALATYYKGDKQSEVSTSIPINPNSTLLTTTDSAFLYLVDKDTGRIYVITKSSGSLEKTLKLNSDQPLVNASMSDDGTIYLLTSDNKVWKVVP